MRRHSPGCWTVDYVIQSGYDASQMAEYTTGEFLGLADNFEYVLSQRRGRAGHYARGETYPTLRPSYSSCPCNHFC